MKSNLLFIVLFFFAATLIAQTSDTLTVKKQEGIIVVKDTVREPYDPLAPQRAAFYSV